ncbi:hypothetical protein FKM82_000824 [Ascaphus truei]
MICSLTKNTTTVGFSGLFSPLVILPDRHFHPKDRLTTHNIAKKISSVCDFTNTLTRLSNCFWSKLQDGNTTYITGTPNCKIISISL